MKSAFACAAVLLASNVVFASEVDLNCQPSDGGNLISIKSTKAVEGKTVSEVNDIQVTSINGQVVFLASNATVTSTLDENGILTDVIALAGRSGSIEIHDLKNGEGVMQSSLFAPGMNYPKPVKINCLQSSPRPALTGSN